jgi:AcrR family transcriptional regulator
VTPAGTLPSAKPLRADAARNRERVLRAAEEVFAAQGLAATLDDVARHAGLGTGTVYRRFPDREALVEALFEARIERTVALVERCLADPDPWQGFATMLSEVCRAMAADRGLRQVVLSSGHGLDRVACARDRIAPLVSRLVDRAQAAGVLRPGVTASDVPLVLHMVCTTADCGPGANDLWERYLQVLLDGLRARDGQAALCVPALCEGQLAEAMERSSVGPRAAGRRPAP